MKRRHFLLTWAALLSLTTAQAQVKVGANPGSITTGATLDVEGSSGARTVIMNDGRVGVNTTNPNTSADLELGSATKALYLNRVANTAAITSPQPGMVIYDLSANCVRVYQGSPAAWSPCITGALGSGGGSVSGLSCGSASFSPSSATANTAYSGTLTVPYTGGNGGTYAAQSFTQNGLSFSLPAGSFASGSGSLLYTISGTPSNSGPMSVSLSAGGQSCGSGSIPALSVSAPAPPSNPAGAGTLNGRSCFDIAEGNDNTNSCGVLSGRTATRADFNQAATNTQTYVFTPAATVSNVRFVYVNTNGQVIQSLTPSANYSGSLSSGSSASAVVSYNPDLSSDNPSSPSNGLAYGLTSTNPLTADIYVVYNDGGSDKQLKLTANVKDCACCGAYVASGVWKNFLCYNLGSTGEAAGVAPSAGDARNHGAKYQYGSKPPFSSGNPGPRWSRFGVTQLEDQSHPGAYATTSPASADGEGEWNRASVSGDPWLMSSTAKGTNDPCPTGYRVPTQAEWQGVINNNSYYTTGSFSTTSNVYTNYSAMVHFGSANNYTLSLPVAGSRDMASWGDLFSRGYVAYYWAKNYVQQLVGQQAEYSVFGASAGGANLISQKSSCAMPVRCIQE